jgi:hypothetical protein
MLRTAKAIKTATKRAMAWKRATMAATKRAMAWKKAMARAARVMATVTRVAGDEEGKGDNRSCQHIFSCFYPGYILNDK